MKKRIETRELSTINESFYVRLALNHERVQFFMDLIRAGTKLDDLILSDDGDLIDGRQRKAAYQELGVTAAQCELRHYDSLTEKIMAALNANVGGPLPPTPEDLTHTLQILLEAKMSRKSIIEQVSQKTGFPPKLLQQYLDVIQSNLAEARLNKAIAAVATLGKTAAEAAEEFHVKIETLQECLGAKKRNKKNAGDAAKHLKSTLGQHYRSLAYSMGKIFPKFAKDLEDGLVLPVEIPAVIHYMEGIRRRFNHNVDDWISRIESHSVTTDKAATTLGRAERKAEKKKQDIGKIALGKMGLES